MFWQIIILIISFLVLIKSADFFVDGAASVALNFKMSKIIVGITIIAFGTSAPELAVSIKALMSNNGDIVLGNVIGSNIINILLVLGVSCLICNLKIQSNTIKKELPITILMSLLLVTLFEDSLFDKSATNFISRSDGFVLLLFFTIFIYYLFSIIRKRSDSSVDDKPKMGLLKSFIFLILGLAGIIIGSNYVVDSAANIASILGVSERMISITIVALGTSLPELVTAIVATTKGEQDLLVGNIIGSNIFNIGVVLALPVAIFGGISGIGFRTLDLLMLVLSAVLFLICAGKDRTVNKKEGFALVMTFVIYYLFVIFG